MRKDMDFPTQEIAKEFRKEALKSISKMCEAMKELSELAEKYYERYGISEERMFDEISLYTFSGDEGEYSYPFDRSYDEQIDAVEYWIETIEAQDRIEPKPYGTDEDLDRRADSDDYVDNHTCIHMKYGLERLAKNGSRDVRIALAEKGYCLDILKNDEDEEVRDTVQKYLEYEKDYDKDKEELER